MEADCYVFRTCEEHRRTLRTYAKSSNAFIIEPLKWIPGEHKPTWNPMAIVNRKDILRDTKLDPPFTWGLPLTIFNARFIQVHPIIIGEELIGVLSVGDFAI